MAFIPVDDGRWVSEEYERLARMVKDYDPNLELRWIPPEGRTEEQDKKYPYMIWDSKRSVPVTKASELDSPVGVLGKLYQMDTSKTDVMGRLQSMDDAQKAWEMQRKADQWEEASDKAEFLFSSNKNYVKMDGKKFDSERRRIE